MPQLEPTYLRYIYDGLIKGSIHPENAAELPDGLIGMYEEAFDERTSVVDRQKLLQRFAIWALLKKEVSAAFVAEILRETEDYIQEFISTYSAWFNSPESGKYQLYHERLKVYLLQKLSEGEIHSLHEKIIERLEKAIEGQKADEFEWYGLEYLAGHLSIAAMLNGQGKKLIDLAYSQRHWQRQLKISKGYSWTKNSLQEVMAWASKYNDDEVIECGLQMVDLHHQEQNAAPQIVALVAEGEFDAALKRIEQFGGSDKEGLQRKFILYMLCLMELTLLESKDKPYRKEGIEKLLKYLDEQFPVDHTILNWGEFFSSYLMFQILSVLETWVIEYSLIFKFTEDLDMSWITENGPYTKSQINVLLNFARSKEELVYVFRMILIELCKQSEFEEAITIANGIGNERNKSILHIQIIDELCEKELMDEAINIALLLPNNERKIGAFEKIVLKFIQLENLKKALEFTIEMIPDYENGKYLGFIASSLAEKGKTEEAFDLTKRLTNQSIKIGALQNIAKALFDHGNVKMALTLFDDAELIIRDLTDEKNKCIALIYQAAHYFDLGQFEAAYKTINESLNISLSLNPVKKSATLMHLAIQFSKWKNIEKALSLINDFPSGNSGSSYKSETLKTIVAEFSKQNKIDDLIESVNLIIDKSDKEEIQGFMAIELASIGFIGESLALINNISEEREVIKNSSLSKIVKLLIEQEKLSEALALAKSIPNTGFSDSYRCEAFKEIALKQLMIGNQEIYISLLTEIGRNRRYNKTIYDGIHQLSLRRKLVDVVSLIEDLLVYQTQQDQEAVKDVFLKDIAVELSNRALFDEALFIQKEITNSDMQDDVLGLLAKQACQKGYYDYSVITSQSIKNKVERIHTLRLISNILYDKGLTKRSQFIFQKATQLSEKITDDYNNDKSEVLNCFALDLSKKEQFKEAYLFIQQIANENTKILALLSMATELHVKEQKTYANTLINEALNCARIFSENVDQCFALIHVAKELNKQGESQRAIKILLEAFSISVNMETEEILGIKDESLKYEIMKDIAVEFSKLGKLQDSMGIIQSMDGNPFMDWKSITFKEIAMELVKLKQWDDCLFILNQITDVSERNHAYRKISVELSNKNEFVLAENVVLEISERNLRKNTIIEMGERFYEQHGWDVSLKYFLNTQNNELYLNYLNSLVEHSNIKDYNLGSLKSIILFMRQDIRALYTATTKYALNQLFFINQNQQQIERFNRTLNIQWAIDIKNQLPN
jgi:hypothetical protein